MLHIWQETMINFLVYVAVRGVEHAQRAYTPQHPASEVRFASAILACALAAVLLLVVANLAAVRHWQRRRLRVGLLLAVSLALGALAWMTWRLIAIDLPQLSPATHEAIKLGPPHRLISAVALIGLVCCSWTYLAIRRSRANTTPISVPLSESWRARVGVPALVFVVYTVLAAAFACQFFNNVVQVKGGGTLFQTWRDFFWAVAYTEYFLMFAIWLTAALLLIRSWRNRHAPSAVHLYGVPSAQFATVLFANLLSLPLAGYLVAWSAFALWLTPWYRWFP